MFTYEERDDPSKVMSVQQMYWEGCIKTAMVQLFQSDKSAEGYCTIQKKPTTGTIVTDRFTANQMMLVCLTRLVSFVVNDGLKKNTPQSWGLNFRSLFRNDDGFELYAVARPDLKCPM